MSYAPGLEQRLYIENFESAAPTGIYTVVQGGVTQQLAPVAEGGNHYVTSTGPWWVDPNHHDPGAGYLHLLAYGYFRTFSNTLGAFGDPHQAIDLRDAEFSFSVKLDDLTLPEDAHVYFWFQASDPDIPAAEGRYVNYAYSAIAIDEVAAGGGWTDVTIPLSTNDADWIALGSNPDREDTYSISQSVAHALSTGYPADCGIIILIGDELPQAPITGSISFDDFSFIAPRSAPADLPYDSLFRNQVTGQVYWGDVDPDGNAIDYRLIGSAGLGWQPIAVKYFADDDAQIVWRDNQSSAVGYWSVLDGEKQGGYRGIGSVANTWVLQAPTDSSDLDGNGADDLLWRDLATGDLTAWMMSGGAVVQSKVIGTTTLDWQVAGTADFTGDGTDDILWFSQSSRLAGYWAMDGSTRSSYRGLDVSGSESVIGTGDFRGDGFADVLWRDDTTGLLGYTNVLNGVKAAYYVLGPLDPAWDVIGISDLDGDRIDDLLIQNASSGELIYWHVAPSVPPVVHAGLGSPSADLQFLL